MLWTTCSTYTSIGPLPDPLNQILEGGSPAIILFSPDLQAIVTNGKMKETLGSSS